MHVKQPVPCWKHNHAPACYVSDLRKRLNQFLIHFPPPQADKMLKNLEWEAEVMQQRYDKVKGERDELYDKFEASIYDVQQKTGARRRHRAACGHLHVLRCAAT